jgi:hypothetical protein
MRKYEDKERWAGHRLLRLMRKVSVQFSAFLVAGRVNSEPGHCFILCLRLQHIVRFAFDKRAFFFGRELESEACRNVLTKAE